MDNLTLCSTPIRHPLFSIQPLLFLLRHLPRSLAQCPQQTPTSGSRSPLLPMPFQTAAFPLERSHLTMAELQSASRSMSTDGRHLIPCSHPAVPSQWLQTSWAALIRPLRLRLGTPQAHLAPSCSTVLRFCPRPRSVSPCRR